MRGLSLLVWKLFAGGVRLFLLMFLTSLIEAWIRPWGSS